jgi:hypothetical protein
MLIVDTGGAGWSGASVPVSSGSSDLRRRERLTVIFVILLWLLYFSRAYRGVNDLEMCQC